MTSLILGCTLYHRTDIIGIGSGKLFVAAIPSSSRYFSNSVPDIWSLLLQSSKVFGRALHRMRALKHSPPADQAEPDGMTTEIFLPVVRSSH